MNYADDSEDDREDEGGAVGVAVDLASGAALPLLYSLRALDDGGLVGAGAALGGAALALAASSAGRGLLLGAEPGCTGAISEGWAQAAGSALRLAGCGLRVVLSMAQLFAQAGSLDADVGAGLYAIPAFALLSMRGVPGNRSRVSARGAVAALSVAVLACGWLSAVYSGPGGGALRAEAPPAGHGGAWWWYALLLSDAAFACADVGRRGAAGWASGWQAFAARGAVFAALAASPRVLSLLLAERQPRWLFVLQNVLLIHSAILQTAAARRLLAGLRLPMPFDSFRVEHPQRALMVWLAPALAAAYAFQWRHPADASEAVLALAAGRALVWALRRWGGNQ